MKVDEAIEKGKHKHWLCASIRKNPSSPKQWFVMLEDVNHLTHMLVDPEENPILSCDLNQLTETLKNIGIREFTVFL
jgi:hypothetical protein